MSRVKGGIQEIVMWKSTAFASGSVGVSSFPATKRKENQCSKISTTQESKRRVATCVPTAGSSMSLRGTHTGKSTRKHGLRRAPPTSALAPSTHPFVLVVGPSVSVVHLHEHNGRTDGASADVGGARWGPCLHALFPVTWGVSHKQCYNIIIALLSPIRS